MSVDGAYDPEAGTCGYCHGVGACPRCWGRVGIDRMERDKDQVIAKLEAQLDNWRGQVKTHLLVATDAKDRAHKMELRISELHDTMARADREREACCRETKMFKDRLDRMSIRLQAARLDGWREVIQRLDVLSLLTCVTFPAWTATIQEISKKLREEMAIQEKPMGEKHCPSCKQPWRSDGEGGCANCGHGHK